MLMGWHYLFCACVLAVCVYWYDVEGGGSLATAVKRVCVLKKTVPEVFASLLVTAFPEGRIEERCVVGWSNMLPSWQTYLARGSGTGDSNSVVFFVEELNGDSRDAWEQK